MEECVGIDDKILREVIIPVMAVPRRAMDGTTHDDEPVNKSQVYITTAGTKGTYSYDRLIGLLVRMVMQPERCIVLGGTWRTPVAMGLQSKTFIKDQKEEGELNAPDNNFISYRLRFLLIIRANGEVLMG